ncbi:MAG: elongation factor G [Desulfobacteraceae bacterium 4572_19]|nr:MAG: elongation factor G [Desulfobacteraceae bacterium 4572_19]
MAQTTDKLRNIALVSHGGAGKTSLAEIMLFKAGATKRLGRIEDGNTTMDFQPEELKRQNSLITGFHNMDWKKHTITLMDTPGDQNVFSNAKTCMLAADGVILLVDATDGVNIRTEQAAEYAQEYNQSVMIFINKLDRERSNFTTSLQSVRDTLTPTPVLIQLPIGTEADFKGIINLISKKAYTYDEKGKASVIDIPEDLTDLVETERETLVEGIAESDDELLERYLEGEKITDEELQAALKKGIVTRQLAPVLCGSALSNIGIDTLCDFICDYMPSPIDRGSWRATDENGEGEIIKNPDENEPFSAFVFQTIIDPYAGRLSIFRIVSGTLGKDGNFYNVNKEAKERFTQLMEIAGKEQKTITSAGPGSIVAVAKLKDTVTGDTICDEDNKVLFKAPEPIHPVITFAVSAKSKGDEDKLFSSLVKLMEEDTALQLERNRETSEILLSGGGLVHIETTVAKLKRQFNVEVEIKTPKVPYRETIKKKVRVQGKHKKQSGGHGQYGDCFIVMEPLPRGGGFEFVDAIVGGVIPRQYIPAVEKGVVEASAKGVLAGFPCVDFKVTVDYGSYHAVDSSEMAFKVAGSIAYKKAAIDAKPILLEPIMEVSVIAPDEYMGDLMGDLNSRRGRVLGMDAAGKKQIIKANVPMAEFLKYAPDLRSMTQGSGTFTMKFSHYDEVPSEIAEKVIEKEKKAQEND